jgi:hypothetical protein
MRQLPRNPWADLPTEPPYVAPADRATMARHPLASERLNLEMLPYPFQGPRAAEVLLLLANPGAGELGADYPAELLGERRKALTFAYSRDPRFATKTWWSARLRRLIEAVGIERVSRGTLSLEYFPYHSPRYKRFPEVLPSQRFGFGLLREALDADKLIVVVRRKKAWLEAVPELRDVDYIEVLNPQSGYISPRNVGQENFERIVERLRGSPSARGHPKFARGRAGVRRDCCECLQPLG